MSFLIFYDKPMDIKVTMFRVLCPVDILLSDKLSPLLHH